MENNEKAFEEMSEAEKENTAREFREKTLSLLNEMKQGIIGNERIVRAIVMSLFTGRLMPGGSVIDKSSRKPVFSGGGNERYSERKNISARPPGELYKGTFMGRFHPLIVGPIGTGKTLIAKRLSDLCGVNFGRIQFVPDLTPGEISRVAAPNEQGGVTFENGVLIVSNLCLADEINRASNKVHAALLEALEESRVTLGRDVYNLQEPFICDATHNPLREEGTYLLGGALLDRFGLCLHSFPPNIEERMAITELSQNKKSVESVKPVLSQEDILEITRFIFDYVTVPEPFKYYCASLMDLTWPVYEDEDGRVEKNKESSKALEVLNEAAGGYVLEQGCSVRADIALTAFAKTEAFMRGRNYVTVDDAKLWLPAIMRHRIILSQAGSTLANFSLSKEIEKIDILGNIISKGPFTSEDELKEQIIRKCIVHLNPDNGGEK